MINRIAKDINVVALVKGEERYVFLFNDENINNAQRSVGRFASNPELSLTWYDAAVLCRQIGQTGEAKND